MVSLLWKEARERLLWAVALILISVYATWTRGYTFYGTPCPETVNWSMGPILIAFLMGASSYTSELTGRRAAFLLTRPVTLAGLLFTKLIISAVVLSVAALVAALSYRIACPAAYDACVAAPGLAVAIRSAMLLTGVAYLVGLSCSSVVAGAAESAVFVVVQGIVLIYAFRVAGAGSERWWWQIMQILWPVPLAVAGLVIARFSLTLPARERLRRYAVVTFACVVLLCGVVYLIPDSLVDEVISSRLSQERIDWSISPDGLYALGRDMKNLYWLDIHRDKVTHLENVYQDYSGVRVVLENVGWSAPHKAYRIGYDRDSWFIRCYDWSEGVLDHQDIPMGRLDGRDGYPNELIASPDGRFAAVLLNTGMDLPQTVVFADIIKGHKLRQSLTKTAGAAVWWQSPNVFCTTGARGEISRLPLPR